MAARQGRLTLRQLQVLHRHGDRTPLHNVLVGSVAPAAVLAEVKQWEAKLPSDQALRELRTRYRLDHGENDVVSNLQRRPFGCLTQRGIEQMESRGVMLAALCEHEGLNLSELRPSDVEVHCNAYVRTQLSVQSLLTGLLAKHGHLAPPVNVLPPHNDMIHTYSVYPEIADLKHALERESDALRAREEELAALKQALQARLPLFSSGAAAFMWSTAGDYFTCRSSHDLPFLPGTAELQEATLTHLAFRFHEFYEHRRIRSLVASQLVDKALQEMDKAMSDTPDAKRLIVYSGHDVSILAVMHAIDVAVVHERSVWPPYSSALTLELLEDEAGKWFTRVRLDGEPLSLRPSTSDSLVSLDDLRAIIRDRIDYVHQG
ncbi:hypothetical protein ATCC90586_001099 [Pythium insidiosum]|nr:hypothetical protein ATCC90586_001099 [Pythium insidiosum]